MDSLIGAYFEATSILSDSIKEQLQILFQDKHLYQNLELINPTFDAAYQLMVSRNEEINDAPKNVLAFVYDKLSKGYWEFSKKNLKVSKSTPTPKPSGQPKTTLLDNLEALVIDPPETIKVYCHFCKNIEPYNLLEIINLTKIPDQRSSKMECKDQLFGFYYICQSCKKAPEFFLVKRKDKKVSLHGRSPIESFFVEKNIPEKQKKYFSDAQVAYNSGQVLAAKFLLRTFLEQFIRDTSQQTGSQDIELLFEEYKHTLRPEFNTLYPSLYPIYTSLSNDLHCADETPDNFQKAKDDIEKHFAAKKLLEDNHIK